MRIAINQHFKNKGCKIDSSWNKNNSGWFHCPTAYDSARTMSINQCINEYIEYLEAEVQANLIGKHLYDDGTTSYYYNINYSDCTFNCYYERLNNGEYEIYFCH